MFAIVTGPFQSLREDRDAAIAGWQRGSAAVRGTRPCIGSLGGQATTSGTGRVGSVTHQRRQSRPSRVRRPLRPGSPGTNRKSWYESAGALTSNVTVPPGRSTTTRRTSSPGRSRTLYSGLASGMRYTPAPSGQRSGRSRAVTSIWMPVIPSTTRGSGFTDSRCGARGLWDLSARLTGTDWPLGMVVGQPSAAVGLGT